MARLEQWVARSPGRFPEEDLISRNAACCRVEGSVGKAGSCLAEAQAVHPDPAGLAQARDLDIITVTVYIDSKAG
jgi:hypothetical protein